MEIKVGNRKGIILQTKNQLCDDNITIKLDDGLFDYTIEDALVTGTITTYSNHRITKISRCFMGSSLEYLDLPYVTQIPINGVQGCSKLKAVNIPSAEQLVDQAFFQCTSLETIDLPSVTRIGSNAFTNCTSLKSVYLYKFFSLGVAFTNCYSLTKFVLYSDKVCPLSKADAFKGCYHILGTVDATYNPEGLKDGYIYVPDNLVEEYKVATNWSVYADQIKPLSELPMEE